MILDMLLEKIERKPELYIGSRSIFALRHFLCGYTMAMQETDPAYDDFIFGEFTAFLAQKYNDRRSVDWSTLISTYEKDGHTTDAFFRLLKEFRHNNF